MNWIIPAIISPAVYTIVTFIDKHLVSNEVKDYNAMPIYTSIVGFLAGLLFFVLTGFPTLSARDAGIVILTGVITSWSTFLYFRALEGEQTSVINILFQTFPVMSLILAYLVLGETITPKQFAGFVFILLGAVGVGLAPRKKGEKIFSQAFLLILIVNFMTAISSVLIKFAIEANSFSKILSYESFGIALGGGIVFLLFPNIRRGFLFNTKSVKKRTIKILLFNEGLFVLAKSLGFYALILGPVALVSVLTGTQAFFAIIFGILLTKFLPRLFHEDISSKGIYKKAVFAGLVLAGIVLIS